MSARIVPLVAPEVLGCPTVMVRQQIVKAAVELCRSAKVWEGELDDITVVSDTRDYTLVAVIGTTGEGEETVNITAPISEITEVSLDGAPLTGTTLPDLRYRYEDWRSEIGTPELYLRMSPTTLSLVPTPTAGGTLGVMVTLRPDLASQTLEDFLVTEYSDILAAGAKYFLMVMLGQKWSNPAMAAYYQEQFYSSIGAASVAASGGNVGAPIRVKPCV